MTTTIQDGRPPRALLAVLNPVMRVVLGSRLGRFVPPFALLEFDGRRSGRHFRVPVGYHRLGDQRVVLTPAPWRHNFGDELPVTVHFRGRSEDLHGQLVRDREAVAAAVAELLASGTSPRLIGLSFPPGTIPTRDDLLRVHRDLIRFS